MGSNRRIHRWLDEQTREPQVSPTYPPSAPSTNAHVPSFHSSDDSGSLCSSCPPTERHVDLNGHHTRLQPPLAPATLAHPHVRYGRAQAVPPMQIRLGPTPFDAGPVVHPLRRMRSYSMDDLTFPAVQRQPGFSGQQFQISPAYPIPTPVIPSGVVRGGNPIIQTYQPTSSYTSPARSRAGSQAGATWNSMQASQAPPFEVSYLYRVLPQNNLNWQGQNPQTALQYQYQLPRPSRQGSMQTASISAPVNPTVYTPVSNVSPPKSRSRSESRSRSKSTREPSKKATKHSRHHSDKSTDQSKGRQTLLQRLINGFTAPMFKPSNSNSKPTARSSREPKSILKKAPRDPPPASYVTVPHPQAAYAPPIQTYIPIPPKPHAHARSQRSQSSHR